MEEFFDEPRQTESESVDISRFLRGIWRRWWLVLGVFLVISIPWLIHLKKQPPVYEAEVWISFENMTGPIPQNLIDSRIRKLRSRSFAEDVTSELGLTMHLTQEKDLQRLERTDVFRYFSTTKDPVPGRYGMYFYPSGFTSLYCNNRRLDSLRTEKIIQDTISYNGIRFCLNPAIPWNRSGVRFEIESFPGTVKSLQSRESITPNRLGNSLRLRLRDTNPKLAAKTANMLADMFVKKSKEIRRENNAFRLNNIKDRLETLQKQLYQSDYQLRQFQETHQVSLDQESSNILNRINGVEGSITQIQFQKEELQMLLDKLDPKDAESAQGVSPRYVYRQIARQTVFDKDADMNITRQQLNDLDQRKAGLVATLPETNPTVIEVSTQIAALEKKIYDLAQKRIKSLNSEIADLQVRLNELQGSLNRLPDEQIRLIRLSRDRKAKEDIHASLLKMYTEAQISEDVINEHVSILDTALPPTHPIGGDKRRNALMGMGAALFLGLMVALILEMADKSVKTQDEVKRYFKLPVLGIIPKVKFDEHELQDSEKAKSISSQIVTHDYSPTPVGEAYRSLRTSLLFSKRAGTINSIVISSVLPGEGKSFTAANLAITMAQQKSKTLLIDADLRRGVLHNSFNCPKKPGLTNYLTGVVSLENVMNETYVPNLHLITCGSLIPNPSELLGSIKMKRFIEGISKRFDFIIFDSPPLVAATDAVVLGTLVSGVAILIRAGKTKREDVGRKLELFNNVEANIIGAILNGAGVEIAHEGYSYYSY